MRHPALNARRWPMTLLAVAAITLGACSATATGTAQSSAQAPTPAGSAAAAAPGAVTIADFAFAPDTITVAAGTTVTWTNNGAAGHTVTADDGSFDSKTIASGATFSQAFAKAGTYAYHCSIHSSMTAKVVVQ